MSMSAEHNKAIIRRYLEDFRTDRSPATLDKYIAEGDRVVVRATVHGVHQGPFMDTPPTGKTVAFPLIIIYKLADGKIVEHWMLTDMLAFMQQIGAMEVAA